MELLVCVAGRQDVRPFEDVMRENDIPCRSPSYGDSEWVEANKTGMVDATYLIVTADSEAVLHEAVSRMARNVEWPEGPPHFSVTAKRPSQSFPAQ